MRIYACGAEIRDGVESGMETGVRLIQLHGGRGLRHGALQPVDELAGTALVRVRGENGEAAPSTVSADMDLAAYGRAEVGHVRQIGTGRLSVQGTIHDSVGRNGNTGKRLVLAHRARRAARPTAGVRT